MKKHSLLKSLFLFVGLAAMTSLSAQVIITGVTDSTAVLNEPFTATMVWSPGTGGAPTWSLYLKPAGMTINSSGVISYTPTSQIDGGRVIVQATNGSGTAEYQFNVYISDAVSCESNLVSYYQLDDGAGTNFVDFAGGYDGTSDVSLAAATGKVGGAVEMTSASEEAPYIAVPDVNQYEWTTLNGFSFSAWIMPYGKPAWGADQLVDQVLWARVNSAGTNMIVFGLDGQTATNVLKPKLRVRANGTQVTVVPAINLPFDSLFHIGYVYAPEGGGPVRLRVYLNGVRQSNPQEYMDPAQNFYMDGPATLGHMRYPGLPVNNFPFNGILDEAMVFNKALSDAEMLAIYNDGMAGEAHCKPGNHAPELVNYFPRTIDQGGTYSVTLVGMDIEGDPVTVGYSSIPDWMAYNVAQKRLYNKVGRPNNDDVGVHTINVTANDGTLSVTRSFNITVVNVNDDPVFTTTQGNTTINEDVAFTYDFTFDEIDAGDVVTVTAPTKPAWLTLNTVSNRLSGTCTDAYLSGAGPTTAFPVTLRIEDAAGAFDEQSFTITVNHINDAPVISGQNVISTDENIAKTITPSVAFSAGHITDPDNVFPDDFTLTVNAGTNYTVSGGNILTPVANFSGVLSVPITLSDGQASVSYTLNVNVNFVNDLPHVTSTAVNYADDYELYEYLLEVEDLDPGDIVVMSAAILPRWLDFNAETGLLSGTPAWNDVGDTTVMILLDDGHVASPVEYQYTLHVLNTNSVPEITSTPAEEWFVGDVYQYTVTATDLDEDDDLTFSAITKPEFLTFTAEATQGTLHGVPTGANIGSHAVLLQVSDGIGIDQQSFNLTIVPTGLEDETLGTLMVYPVPATTELNIEYEGLVSGATFQIINLNGRTITMESLEYGSGKITIDVSSYNTGMYIYRVIQGDAIVNGKFIIE